MVTIISILQLPIVEIDQILALGNTDFYAINYQQIKNEDLDLIKRREVIRIIDSLNKFSTIESNFIRSSFFPKILTCENIIDALFYYANFLLAENQSLRKDVDTLENAINESVNNEIFELQQWDEVDK